MVARVSGNPGETQELSNKKRGDLDEKSPRRKLSSEDVLEDDLRTSEKWWGGDLNPRPAGYESARQFAELPDTTESYDDAETSVARQVATQSVDTGCDGMMIPDDLSEVIRLWPLLPNEIKRAVLTLVRSVVRDPTDS